MIYKFLIAIILFVMPISAYAQNISLQSGLSQSYGNRKMDKLDRDYFYTGRGTYLLLSVQPGKHSRVSGEFGLRLNRLFFETAETHASTTQYQQYNGDITRFFLQTGFQYHIIADPHKKFRISTGMNINTIVFHRGTETAYREECGYDSGAYYYREFEFEQPIRIGEQMPRFRPMANVTLAYLLRSGKNYKLDISYTYEKCILLDITIQRRYYTGYHQLGIGIRFVNNN